MTCRKLLDEFSKNQKPWHRGVVVITTAQLLQQSLNSGSGQVEILLMTC